MILGETGDINAGQESGDLSGWNCLHGIYASSMWRAVQVIYFRLFTQQGLQVARRRATLHPSQQTKQRRGQEIEPARHALAGVTPG